MLTAKEYYRKEFTKRANALNAEEKEELSKKIIANLVSVIPSFQTLSIGLYMPMNNEPDILTLKSHFDYNYSLPRIKGETLEYVHWTPTSKFCINTQFNVSELEGTNIITPGLVLVPGIAFSLNGIRLGHGKGHFDRYITQRRETQRKKQFYVAICFHDMLTTTLPYEAHDQKMDWVITDKMVLKICN